MAVFCPSVATAQDTVPPISGLEDNDNIQLPLVMGTNRFATDNAYLEDTLHLQYQISLLERMVERQAGIARLEKNYLDLGVSFDQPVPPHGICRQIPANIPCFRAYPDLYDVVLPEFSMLEVEDEPAPIQETIEQSEPQVEEPVVEATPPQLSDSYRWADVLCGGGVCSSTLIKTTNPGFRRTVQQGDTLEDGSITIKTISSGGVFVIENGKEIELESALSPARGGPSSSRLGPSNTPQEALLDNPNGEFLRDVLSNDADVSELNNVFDEESLGDQPLPVPEDEPIEDPGSPLGPTGLF